MESFLLMRKSRRSLKIAVANAAGFPVDGAESGEIAPLHISLACTPSGEHFGNMTVRQVYVPLSVLLSSLFRFKKRTEVRKVYEIMSLSHIYVVYIALLLRT